MIYALWFSFFCFANILNDDVRIFKSRLYHTKFAIASLTHKFGKLIFTHFYITDRGVYNTILAKLCIPIFNCKFNFGCNFGSFLHFGNDVGCFLLT